MRKRILISIFALLFIVVIVLVLFLSGVLKSQGSRLYIESNPPSTVYVNSEAVGRTPLEKDFKAGETVVKLVPDPTDRPLTPYETKVMLTPGVKTVIRRNIGETLDQSSGQVISFEKLAKEVAASIISNPDGAGVKVDGQVRGVTPIKLTDLTPGTHQLTISAPGYQDQNFSIVTVSGYRLIAIVQLAFTGENERTLSQPSPSPSSETKEEKLVVEILNTPTGYLRVRQEPTQTSSEVARVAPGKKFNYLGKDEQSGWLKIELEDGKNGWVSSEYATASAEVTSQ